MIKPSRPRDDASRVAALHALDILDTPREERYDRITRRLAVTLGMSIAYVALLDADRQWLKSNAGCMPTETGRDQSFCAHTILGDEPLIVRDASRDPRFRGNPMVVGEPHIRFYAGVPLVGSDGQNVGTVCVADPRPREFGAADLRVLVAHAAQIQERLNAEPTIFISYSHRDDHWKDRLLRHLSVLQRQNHLILWDDERIETGEAWRNEIQEALESSKLAILLISSHFLTSEFVLGVEVPYLLKRRDAEGIQILPVLVEPCCWNCVDWLEAMNIYPRDARPLSGESDHEIDHRLSEFAAVVLEKVRMPRGSSPPRVSTPAPPRPQPVSPRPVETIEMIEKPEPAPRRAGRRMRLILTSGPDSGAASETFVFQRDVVTLGRGGGCDLRLRNDQVSTRHAEIVAADGLFHLADLGSKNFTYLNGQQLVPHRHYDLRAGDTIELCGFQIRFEVREVEPSAMDETDFVSSYVNPFLSDMLRFADVVRRIGELYDEEAPSRRDDALGIALRAALGDDAGHPAQTALARLLDEPPRIDATIEADPSGP
jgi:hypothetical protein